MKQIRNNKIPLVHTPMKCAALWKLRNVRRYREHKITFNVQAFTNAQVLQSSQHTALSAYYVSGLQLKVLHPLVFYHYAAHKLHNVYIMKPPLINIHKFCAKHIMNSRLFKKINIKFK